MSLGWCTGFFCLWSVLVSSWCFLFPSSWTSNLTWTRIHLELSGCQSCELLLLCVMFGFWTPFMLLVFPRVGVPLGCSLVSLLSPSWVQAASMSTSYNWYAFQIIVFVCFKSPSVHLPCWLPRNDFIIILLTGLLKKRFVISISHHFFIAWYKFALLFPRCVVCLLLPKFYPHCYLSVLEPFQM